MHKREVSLSLLFSVVLKILTSVVRQEKDMKGIQIGKKDKKLSLLIDDMIICIENSKESTQKSPVVNKQ